MYPFLFSVHAAMSTNCREMELFDNLSAFKDFKFEKCGVAREAVIPHLDFLQSTRSPQHVRIQAPCILELST